MRILKALVHRPIRQLWMGQVFSGLGDEVYMIALVWFASNLIGTSAGYVASVQAASIFIFSLIGGIWVDHHDDRRIMIVTDLVRGFVVLLLPLSAFFMPLSLWLLVPVAILVASLSAFFNPALKAFLPRLIEERELLETTNGLMETTNRFARVIGPGTIALLSRFIPVVHYFTLDAISFFVSAWSIAKIKKESIQSHVRHERSSLSETLRAGYKLSRTNSLIAFILYSGALAGAAWLFVYPLGITLYLREKITPDVGALGMAIFGYGIGNLSCNLLISNLKIARPARLIFYGEIFGGAGFILFALSQNLYQAMGACAITAIGGPMTDLGFVNLLQRHFRGRDLLRVHRFNMAIGYGCLLIALLISPQLFNWFSVPSVVTACAFTILIPGVLGLILFKND